MHQEKIYDETTNNYLQLARLIYSNQLDLCSNCKMKSIRDFSSHLIFVSSYIERKKLQNHIFTLLQPCNFNKEGSYPDRNAIIYPQIFVIEELHNQFFTNEKPEFFTIQDQLQNTSILQIALKYFMEEYQSDKCKITYELEFIVQKLSLLNNLLKYKSKSEIFSSHEADLAWIIKAFSNNSLTDKIFDELPNMKNHKVILSLDPDALEEKFTHIYQLVNYGEYNLLHSALFNKISDCKNFHFFHASHSTTAEKNINILKKSLENRYTKIDFTSTRHYEEALAYLINKDIVDSDNIEKTVLIVCDNESLAKRVYSYLPNHGSVKEKDIELCGYRDLYSDITVQCFIKLAKLIFGKVDINHYVDFITNSLLESYSITNHFKTSEMHGVRMNLDCFEDLYQNFEQQLKVNSSLSCAQNKLSNSIEDALDNPDITDNSICNLNTTLSAARTKAWSNSLKHNSFLSKIILLNDIFQKLISEGEISNRNLYRFQEIAYQIKLQNCSKERFLDILQHIALSFTLKDDRDIRSPFQVKIIKSTNLNCIDYALQSSAVYMISLDINLHLSAQKHLNLSAESQYKYNPLNKVRAEIASADSVILFHDISNVKDGINFQLLQLNSIDGDYCKLERCINNSYIFDSTDIDDENSKNDNNHNTVITSPIDLLTAKDADYFIKPICLSISSIYVTALRRLVNDPQSYFIQDILKVRPIDQFNDYSYKKHFGIMCHDIINSATQNYQSAQGEEAFLTYFAKEFKSAAQFNLNEEHYLATYAKVEQIGKNVLENLNFDAQNIMQEKEISHTINVDGKAINIVARVDRMENNHDNTCIIDYKTGTIPSISAIKNFDDPQMMGEAYIAHKMFFTAADGLSTSAENNNLSESSAKDQCITHPKNISKNTDYRYFIKLIKVNAAHGKACITLDVTDIIPRFEEAIIELIREYLITDDAKF